jgi:hypothetical protein
VADSDTKKCFLIMPFQSKLDWLRRIVVEAGSVVGVKVERADDIFAPGSILQQILGSIDDADVVVCICTDRNPNVFFELGYAWNKHNPVLIAEDASDLPSDFSHYRTIIYGEPSPDLDQAKLGEEIAKHMQAVLNEGPRSAARPSGADEHQRGVVLIAPPTPKSTVRVSLRYVRGSKGSGRLALGNSGTVDLYDVNVHLPDEVQWLHLMDRDLPIDVLRPGEQVELMTAASMGSGPRIFDAHVTGRTPDGEAFSQPVKISS